MKRRLFLGLVVVAFLGVVWFIISQQGGGSETASGRLVIFAGSATKPATEELAQLFEASRGVDIDLHFGGSGTMLSQMLITKTGDIYFPGSSDFMEKAKQEGVIREETERITAYLVPAVVVRKGNPLNIGSLVDLARNDVRMAIANPVTVCVGLYAVEILEKTGLSERIRPRIATYAESCSKTAGLVASGSVDAVLGWRVFQYWSPETMEAVLLAPEEVARIGYIPIGVSSFSEKPDLAQEFIDYVVSPEGKAVFAKWNYITEEEEARRFASASTSVGGEWPLPESWR